MFWKLRLSHIIGKESKMRQKIVLLVLTFASMTLVDGLCPTRCTCDDDSLIVMCSGAKLDVIPITLNPGLKELHLRTNQIKDIMGSLDVYSHLSSLDMSHNHLVNLGRKNFMYQRNLKILLLNHNFISSLDIAAFVGLSELQILHLNNNYLEHLPARVFSVLSRLEKLDLSQNGISALNEDVFIGLIKLKFLVLRDNKFQHVPTQSFRPIPHLIELDMGLNPLKSVPEDGFISLSHLEVLNLDGCDIPTVRPGTFRWLPSLLLLRLHNNDLTEIPTDALKDLSSLEELHIGQNRFLEIGTLAFRGLHFLRVLVINGARDLKFIRAGAFQDNLGLHRMVMNHNKKLSVIESGAFEGLRALQYLSLRGDGFKTLQEPLMPWLDLKYLDLRDNPWTCNCSLVWLAQLLRNKNFSHLSEQNALYCEQPISLRNRVFSDLDESDFHCGFGLKLHIILGAAIACVVTSAAVLFVVLWYRARVSKAFKKKWDHNGLDKRFPPVPPTREEIIRAVPHLPSHHSLKLSPVSDY